MGKWEQVKAWLRVEAKEIKGTVDDLEARLDRDLTAKEQRLSETPAEGLARMQQEIEHGDSSFDALRDEITTNAASADSAGGDPGVALDPNGNESDPDDLDRG